MEFFVRGSHFPIREFVCASVNGGCSFFNKKMEFVKMSALCEKKKNKEKKNGVR